MKKYIFDWKNMYGNEKAVLPHQIFKFFWARARPGPARDHWDQGPDHGTIGTRDHGSIGTRDHGSIGTTGPGTMGPLGPWDRAGPKVKSNFLIGGVVGIILFVLFLYLFLWFWQMYENRVF